MNIIEALLGDQAGGAVDQLGRQFGLDASQTSSALGGQGGGGGILDMLTPMLDSNRDGSAVDDIVGMIGKFMGGR